MEKLKETFLIKFPIKNRKNRTEKMQTKQNTIVYKIATNKQKNEMMELAYSPGLSFE